jgi:AhpD family alkylhydroperoxidase
VTDFVASGTGLPARMREFVVLRTSQLLGNEFEWNFHSNSALKRGLDADEISALTRWQIPDSCSVPERAALTLVDQCIAGEVTDDCIAELQVLLSSREIVELCLFIGYYRMAQTLAVVAGYTDEAPQPSVPLSL